MILSHLRPLESIAPGPAAGNTVGICGVVSTSHRQRLFRSNFHTRRLTVIDTARRAFAGVIRVEEREQRGLMEMARHPRNGRIYVANELKHWLFVVDPEKERLEAVIETGREPHYVDFDERTGHIFVACGGTTPCSCWTPATGS